MSDILDEIADCIDSGSSEGIRHLAYQLRQDEEVERTGGTCKYCYGNGCSICNNTGVALR